MYASLIGAGASQLYDLLRSQTKSSDPTTSSSGATPASGSTSSTTTGTGATGALSSDLNSLLLDLQSGGTTSTATASSAADPTTTVANDLQSVFGDLQKADGAHGHHHHHHAAEADPQSASNSATGGTGSQPGTANPFQNLASSLLAYTKGQGLSASQNGSTSLTA